MSCYCPIRDGRVVYLECKECDSRMCEAFFCLVVGSRSFCDYDLMVQKLDHLLQNHKKIVIVSGGAKGSDKMAERYAHEHGYPTKIFPADWYSYGLSAGFIRNREMHQFLSRQKKRGVVAFWDGLSHGTQHSFLLAEEFNNPLKLIMVNKERRNA